MYVSRRDEIPPASGRFINVEKTEKKEEEKNEDEENAHFSG